MANPSMQYQSLTGDAFVDSMTTGFSWSLDESRSLDYSVSNGIYGEYWFDPSSVSQYLGAALSLYANYANISFSNLGLFSDPIAAANAGSEINVSLDASNLFFSSYNSWAIGFFPNSEFNSLLYEGAAGDIYINVNSGANYLPSYEPGSQGWFLLLHELGHTLGLKHPHDDGGTGRPTFSELGIGELDIDLATVMSYNDDAEWNRFSWDPATPMVLDVLALQYLYGKNESTNAGDTSHYLDELVGYYATLWDASGADWISTNQTSFGWWIELPEGSVSSLSDEPVGYAMPIFDSLQDVPTTLVWLVGEYENAAGSSYDDVIVGNSLDNRIDAAGSDDLIYFSAGIDRVNGGPGADTLILSSASFNDITFQSLAADVTGQTYPFAIGLKGTDDKTFFTGIEYVELSDGRYSPEFLASSFDSWLSESVTRVIRLIDGPVTLSSNLSEEVRDESNSLTFLDYPNYFVDSVVQWDPTDGASQVIIGYTPNRTSDRLEDIERLVVSTGQQRATINGEVVFGRDIVAFDFDGAAGQGYRIYKAAFDRFPDFMGLGYWIDQLDEGMDLIEVSARFIDSAEFRSLYGESPSNGEFLTAVYRNVLDREPDASGYAWWVDQLQNNPEKTWAKVLADFSESPENVSNVIDIVADMGIRYHDFWG